MYIYNVNFELTVNKEVSKVATCSFALMLTLNQSTDVLLEELKVTPGTKNNFCVIWPQVKNAFFFIEELFSVQDLAFLTIPYIAKSMTS